jgi:hypothetical protein
MALPTGFALQLAAIAIAEFETHGEHHATDAEFTRRIHGYRQETGLAPDGPEAPWSAAFISWCVMRAGAAPGSFLISSRHSAPLYRAIRDARADRGCFRGMPYDAQPPLPGDILHFNQPGGMIDFAHAGQHAQYPSQAAIVVAVVRDHHGSAAMLVGAADTQGLNRRRVALGGDGLIVQRAGQEFFALVRAEA